MNTRIDDADRQRRRYSHHEGYEVRPAYRRDPDAFDSFGAGMEDVANVVAMIWRWWFADPIRTGLTAIALIAVLTVGFWDLFH